jgi:uncharacterized protein YkwD
MPATIPVRRGRISVALAVSLMAASACGSKSPTAPSSLTISSQPESQTIAPGTSATMSVSATGNGTINYQWFVGSSGQTSAPIDGATSSGYTTPAMSETTRYWVRLSDSSSTADSASATITVTAGDAPSGPAPATAPTLTSQPASQTIAAGQQATLTVDADGTAPMSFTWYIGRSGSTSSPAGGANAKTFTTPALQATTSYWVRVSNAAGSVDSGAATITVTAPPPAGTAPSIATQPQHQTINSGQAATLSVAANGTAPLAYQWYQGSSGTTSSPVGGATGASFATPALTATTTYWVRVSNGFGSSDSDAATVTVAPPPPAGVAPTITLQPQGQTINSGQTATLVFAAGGTSPLSYQWYAGPSGTMSSPIGGATSSSFTTPALTATTSYWVRVSNPFGAVNSNTATITVVSVSSNPSAEDVVLALINQRRAAGATCGGTSYPPVAALAMNPNLQTAARLHSLDMATQNYFSHTSLDGRTFDQRIRNAGYTGGFPLGENIGAGQATPQSVVDGWMNSPGHCANIMNAGFRSTGVGYAFNSSAQYRHYWTQVFGGS